MIIIRQHTFEQHLLIQWLASNNNLVAYLDATNEFTANGASETGLLTGSPPRFIINALGNVVSESNWYAISQDWEQFLLANEVIIVNANKAYKLLERGDRNRDRNSD